jgi:sulfopyruvate decarboxylase subunit beta
MDRDLCFQVLARHVDGEIVVSAYQGAFAWLRIHPHELNCYSVGAMGLASSLGFGLAIGRPDKRVIVLDGDGSLLMNLGSLVTAAEAAPRNFFHFVCENGTYEANGGHPTPGRGHVDFAALATAAGYRSVRVFSELKIFEQQIGALLQEPGPIFVDLKVTPSGPQNRDYSQLHGPAVRQAFKDALTASR